MRTKNEKPEQRKQAQTQQKHQQQRLYLNKYTDMFVSLAFGTVKMVSFPIKYKYRSESVRKRGRK